ncbi:ComEA family DNA-binding protein [Shewanella youngdeokensis]|uniref:Helix-hairpin-helix domain-containing protein n=1 Tax=Shewanella youngdeokensis TaxID=2999068 RepID=A0ABZ0JWD5_9GAMM|nr:helix-hairpin-helix domain-containing protein [Shewanella sp. DAU334]
MYNKFIPALLLSFSLLPVAEAATEKPQPISVQQAEVININSASVEQLSSLKGVGESKAKAIVDYRKTHGKFDSIEDLSEVKGIGEKLIEKNKAALSL